MYTEPLMRLGISALAAMKVATEAVTPVVPMPMFHHRMAMLPISVDENVAGPGARWNIRRFDVSRRDVCGRDGSGSAETDTNGNARTGKKRATGQNQSCEQFAFHNCLLCTPSGMHGRDRFEATENTHAVTRQVGGSKPHWWWIANIPTGRVPPDPFGARRTH